MSRINKRDSNTLTLMKSRKTKPIITMEIMIMPVMHLIITKQIENSINK